MCRSMNEHDIVRVNETVIATPNFEDTPVEIKAGWRGALIADADKPTPCLEFNEDYRGKPILGGPGRYQFGSGLDSRMKKVVYLRPPIDCSLFLAWWRRRMGHENRLLDRVQLRPEAGIHC